MRKTEFLRTLIADPKVAAVTASSPHVIKRVLRALPVSLKDVVEYGPGDGVITRELLRIVPADGSVIAIETNDRFAALLAAGADPRLHLLHADVRTAIEDTAIFPSKAFDVVVSGIPFTMLKPSDREAVVRRTADMLRPGGVFLVYQFSPLMVRYLKQAFEDVRTDFEPRNFPPYFIMTARKGE